MKPSELAPLTATPLLRAAPRGRLPAGHLNLVHGPGAHVGPWLVENQDIDFYTFTGSTARRRLAARARRPAAGAARAGQHLADDRLRGRRSRSRRRAVRGVGVPPRRTDVHLDAAAVRAARRRAGLRATGCMRAAAALQVGDPRDPRTDVGPMISEREAIRAESWVREAVAAGATLRARRPPRRRAAVPDHPRRRRSGACASCARKSSRPCVSIIPYTTLDEAIAAGQRHAVRARRRHLLAGHHARDDRGPPPPRRRRARQRRRRAAAST